jgi:hypothetical protein
VQQQQQQQQSTLSMPETTEVLISMQQQSKKLPSALNIVPQMRNAHFFQRLSTPILTMALWLLLSCCLRRQLLMVKLVALLSLKGSGIVFRTHCTL